ncbi:sugar transferase [Emcibacter nanhaiensis]|uniref:Sugar transferase n=1 Tax=Emcibacter nanhaiensis TaxID=1505037 RepID=A0A501PBI7_9PROT|nr:sugar transferase [Emcibacter nanhaiensis]TPD57407.1 sugar transferase [Emcibacter nanhaiensis]
MKRVFDFSLALILLIILSPLLIPVMLILRFTGEGEVFYRQERMGTGNKPFFITKFATMQKNSPNIGAGDVTLKNDPRVLPFGKFLRKTKINELPQLWDVLVGTMSFVGPRPQTLGIHASYPPEFDEVLNNLRPGITGIGSIAFRDEENILAEASDYDDCYRNQIIPHKARLEKWYMDNQSFLMDLLIILVTAWVVLFPNSNLLYRIYPTLPKFSVQNG